MKNNIVIPQNTGVRLKDLGLNIKEIVLYITSECNLRCKHCYIGNSLLNEANEIEFASIKSFISNYLELDRITILGGEFFMYKDALKVMEFVALSNIKEKRITTNLNYLTDDIIDVAKSGNIRMCVSLDGHTKKLHESIRGRNTFDITIQNILQLIKNNIDVEIIHTVNSFSYEHVLELIDFLKKTGIRRLNLHKISLKGNALDNSELSITPTMWRKLIKKLEDQSFSIQNKSIIVRHELGYATLEEYDILKAQNYHPHSSGSFYSENGHRVIIYPDGKVYISSEAFSTESFIGSFDNNMFIPNISDFNEIKLSESNDFDVSFLNSDLQGDSNFPIALSVSFRKSLSL